MNLCSPILLKVTELLKDTEALFQYPWMKKLKSKYTLKIPSVIDGFFSKMVWSEGYLN